MVTTFTWRRTALGFFVVVPLVAFVRDRTNLQETAGALAETNCTLVAAAIVALGLAIWLAGPENRPSKSAQAGLGISWNP